MILRICFKTTHSILIPDSLQPLQSLPSGRCGAAETTPSKSLSKGTNIALIVLPLALSSECKATEECWTPSDAVS